MIFKLLVCLALLGKIYAFEKALPGYEYEFPRDHFSHPNFQSEWWYYTGNIWTKEGRRFGFELTFFRQGQPRESRRESVWEIENIYLAHFALSDIGQGRFHKSERVNRSGPGLAGADTAQGRIWNGNWEVRWLDPRRSQGRQRLQAVTREITAQFELKPQKPPVIHGRNGVSQKAAGEGQASHYISWTRLAVEGTLLLSGERHNVQGTAWMDHEFFTHQMGQEQIGWDWASIQLENNTELMVYRLRRSDGSADPYSSGTYVLSDGSSRHLEWGEVLMEPLGAVWESPATGGRYPLRWRVTAPSLDLELTIETDFRKQEVVSTQGRSPNYWEGAIDATGQVAENSVRGVGYLELTGYDKPLSLVRTPPETEQ